MVKKWITVKPKRWWMLWSYPYCWFVRKKLNTQEQYDDFYARVKPWKMTTGTVEWRN